MSIALPTQPTVELEEQTTAWNPPLSWDIVSLPKRHGNVFVIRDDRLPGGTKQRAAVPFVTRLKTDGIKTCVYASPSSGYAQIALAKSCEIAGVRCVIFAERLNGRISNFTREACASLTTSIEMCESLAAAEIDAQAFAGQQADTFKVPLGFASLAFKADLLDAISERWHNFTQQIGRQPDRIWLPVGSGTLLSIMRLLLPADCCIMAVDVGVLPENDKRIQAAKSTSNTEYVRLNLPFSMPAVVQPPVPSNSYYDAKLWQVIEQHGKDGDVWWNVAR